ncbi:MAG TPA: RnfABCDGE type electron transport complex subunit D [Bacilli bacterium]|nr:RnfABCDGE type electron transport complex subunit D [Bacilli bacterium]
MKFIVTPGPFQRGKHKTAIVMRDLMIALVIVWAASIIYNFTIAPAYGIKAILMGVVAMAVTLLCDVLVSAIRYKPDKGPFAKVLLKDVFQNFSLVTALIFALTLPIGTPYFVLIVGSIFGTLIVKYAFGGFGHNIFNPAAFARIFVALTFASSLTPHLGDASIVPTLSAGATITTAFSSSGSAIGLKWLTDSLSGLNVNMGQLWLGFYSGALGEPFALLILLLGIGLAARRALNWRTPVFYLGTVALTAIVIALFANLNPLDYALIHLGMGGLMFGAVFMLTDPVSSPTSPFGKALIGVIAGLMTVLIRIQGNLPEGVVFAIAIANVVSPLIDRYAFAMTNKHLDKKWAMIGSLLFVSMALNGTIAFVRVKGQVDPSSSSSEPPLIEPFKVLSGSAESAACDDYCSVQTQEVNVNLDEAFNILSIELLTASTTGGVYQTNWDTAEADILAYYASLSIEEIQALDEAALPDDAFAVGVTISGQRLLLAIQDALKYVEVYTGSATSNAYPDHYDDQTTEVTVYVIDGVIESIALGGTVTTGGTYATRWEAAYPAVFDYYVGMSVTEFLALGAFPAATDAFVIGLTYTAERIYDAMIDALSTYGG